MEYWHYTTGDCLALIRSDGFIKPATAHVPEHEKPILWLSTRKGWAPTATKGILDSATGKITTATLRQLHDMAGGLFGLRVEGVEVHSWPELAELAGIASGMRTGLERSARAVNDDPTEWVGTFQQIPLSSVVAIAQIDPATGLPLHSPFAMLSTSGNTPINPGRTA